MKGRIIAIEGVDGSGKETQTRLLKLKLLKHGIKSESISFPRYHTRTGKMIVDYLHGKLKFSDDHFVPLLYALNRFEYSDTIKKILKKTRILVIDRYVGSNLIHQNAKPDWIKTLEYKILNLAKPDLTLLLDLPVDISAKLIRSRKKDLLESNHKHQEKALAKARKLYRSDKTWIKINCSEKGEILSKDEVSKKIWKEVSKFLKF